MSNKLYLIVSVESSWGMKVVSSFTDEQSAKDQFRKMVEGACNEGESYSEIYEINESEGLDFATLHDDDFFLTWGDEHSGFGIVTLNV